MSGAGEKEISIFCCKVAGQSYAFQVTDITNVLETDQLLNTKFESTLIMGLASMQNKQIPVVDLGHILHDNRSAQTFGASIIVVKNWYKEYVFEIGLYIDSVIGVYDVLISMQGTMKPLEEEEGEMRFQQMKLLEPQTIFSYDEKGLLFNHFKSTENKEVQKDKAARKKS